MIAKLVNTPEDFLAITLEFRESEAIRTNLIGSIATSVATGDQKYDKCYWWVVCASDKVIGCAVHNAPYGFAISPMSDEAAVVLAEAVINSDEIPFPSVFGSFQSATAFINTYEQLKDSEKNKLNLFKMLMYEMDTLVKPTNVIGYLHHCTMADLETIIEFTKLYLIESGEYDLVDLREASKHKITEGLLYLWKLDDGTPVAMGAHDVVVPSGSVPVGCIGPIFTPKQYRKNGYGSAITAGITEVLQENGAKVMLFANAENPTSNAIYQAIGFRLTGENAEYRYEDTNQ